VSSRIATARGGDGLEATILLEALARARPSGDRRRPPARLTTRRCRRARCAAPAVATVWLEAKLATLVARTTQTPTVPRYREGTATALARQLAAAASTSAQTATATVDVDGLTPRRCSSGSPAAIAAAG